jgi:hypothetical protein
MGFHFIIALTFLLSSILFTWPYHANRWDFINRTIFSSLISASISWFVSRQHPDYWYFSHYYHQISREDFKFVRDLLLP